LQVLLLLSYVTRRLPILGNYIVSLRLRLELIENGQIEEWEQLIWLLLLLLLLLLLVS